MAYVNGVLSSERHRRIYHLQSKSNGKKCCISISFLWLSTGQDKSINEATKGVYKNSLKIM